MGKHDKQCLPYFAGKRAAFVNNADVFLLLDSGEALPVHSAYLTSHSEVFSDMLSIERPSSAQLYVPFPDCSMDNACALLWYIYAMDRDEDDVIKRAPMILELADKLKMKAVLQSINNVLSANVADDGKASRLWVSQRQYLLDTKSVGYLAAYIPGKLVV